RWVFSQSTDFLIGKHIREYDVLCNYATRGNDGHAMLDLLRLLIYRDERPSEGKFPENGAHQVHDTTRRRMARVTHFHNYYRAAITASASAGRRLSSCRGGRWWVCNIKNGNAMGENIRSHLALRKVALPFGHFS